MDVVGVRAASGYDNTGDDIADGRAAEGGVEVVLDFMVVVDDVVRGKFGREFILAIVKGHSL